MNFINQVITEQDIEVTLRDFETYCRFVEERKPKLTPARSELGKKECFELDKLLTYSKGFDSPKYLQVAYPSINLWFHVSTAAGFFGVEAGKGANRILVPTKRLELFRELNSFSQYLYLFRIFWTKINWDELYYDTMDMIGHFFYIQLGFHALKEAIPGERIFADIDNFDECYDRHNPIHRMFVGAGIVIHHLQDFGFWRYERAYKPRLYFSERDIDVKAITPTKLGMVMINCCLKRPLEMYNMFLEEESIRSQWSCESVKPILEKLKLNSPRLVVKNESFESEFIKHFPDGAINQNAIEKLLIPGKDVAGGKANAFIFKISQGKGCLRLIMLSAAHTLQHLHEAILEAFGFWDDHLFAFFMDGKPWSKKAFWDKREGIKPTADKAVIDKLGLKKGQEFLYLFDFGDKWHFSVKLEDIESIEAAPVKPVIMKKYGKNPVQY